MSRNIVLILIIVLLSTAIGSEIWRWQSEEDEDADALHYKIVDLLFEILKPSASNIEQKTAVCSLIDRNFKHLAEYIEIKVDPSIRSPNANEEVAKILAPEGATASIRIVGSSGTAVTFGLNTYLRENFGIQIAWDGKQLETLPKQLKRYTGQPIIMQSLGRLRYYSNICTFSYSFVFWDWPDWEQHIDWLALNGMNFPLMSVGQEYLWEKVFSQMGLSKSEIREYFTGPAFLAWNRMGNFKRWAGPLSDDFLYKQQLLAVKIVKRMVSLGMIPVFPGFAGHVPDAFARLYPNANITKLNWGHFNCSYTCMATLAPWDPTFGQIQKLLIDQIFLEFGNVSHAFNADPFNEMIPSSDLGYLRLFSEQTYKSMIDADPLAVWVPQGWMFVSDDFWTDERVKAFVTAVPVGRMLILDLYSETEPQYIRTESYHGQPYIWCMLHNFGGNTGMWGNIPTINSRMLNAVSMKNSTMIGTGLTMEGIYQNYLMYQFLLDRSWSRAEINASSWVTTYATQRYGVDLKDTPSLNAAWQKLLQTVYNFSMASNQYQMQHIVLKEPSLHMISGELWYTLADLCNIWEHFYENYELADRSDLFRYDFVDLSRQLLEHIGRDLYAEMIDAYQNHSVAQFKKSARHLLRLLSQLEEILRTNTHFLLGRWLKQAENLASSSNEKLLFVFNMKNQLTTWGPKNGILDYARKSWSGLIADYYAPRWKLFTEKLLDDLVYGIRFNQTAFRDEVYNQVELPFTLNTKNYDDEPSGDLTRNVDRIYRQYILQERCLLNGKQR